MKSFKILPGQTELLDHRKRLIFLNIYDAQCNTRPWGLKLSFPDITVLRIFKVVDLDFSCWIIPSILNSYRTDSDYLY